MVPIVSDCLHMMINFLCGMSVVTYNFKRLATEEILATEDVSGLSSISKLMRYEGKVTAAVVIHGTFCTECESRAIK